MSCRKCFDDCNAWYENPAYASYWKHYHAMQQWMQCREYYESKERAMVEKELKCKLLGCSHCHRSSHIMANQAAFINSPKCDKCTAKHSTGSKSRKTEKRKEKSRVENTGSRRNKVTETVLVQLEEYEDTICEDESCLQESEESDPEYEFLVTDEYIKFVKQAEAYRRKRDAEKKKKGNGDNVEYVDLASITVDGMPGSGQPNVNVKAEKKRQLMESWYGKNAAAITGMETAMGCSFNWFKTHQKPVLWPNIPLRIKFD